MNPARFRWLAAITALSAYLQIALGGVVRVSGSGLGCEKDWPLCQGRLLPPLEIHALVEYLHRTVGSVTGLLIVATVVSAWALYRRRRPAIAGLATAALSAVVLEGLFGAVVVFRDLAAWLVLVHIALAMLIVGLLIATAIFALPPSPGDRRVSSVLTLAAILTYLMVLSGSAVVASGADSACHAWPLCGGGLTPDFGGVNAFTMVHRLTVGVTGVLLVYGLVAALRAGGIPHLRSAAVFTLAVFAIQVGIGIGAALVPDNGFLNGFHVAVATAVWSGAVGAALLALPRAPTEERGAVAGLAEPA